MEIKEEDKLSNLRKKKKKGILPIITEMASLFNYWKIRDTFSRASIDSVVITFNINSFSITGRYQRVAKGIDSIVTAFNINSKSIIMRCERYFT